MQIVSFLYYFIIIVLKVRFNEVPTTIYEHCKHFIYENVCRIERARQLNLSIQ